MSPILRNPHHLGRHILARLEINKLLRPKLQAQIPLLIAPIDRNDPHPHRLRILHREMAQPSTRPRNNEPLSRLHTAPLAPRVRGDAAAEERPGFFVGYPVGKARCVVCVGEAVFLEGAGGAEARV